MEDKLVKVDSSAINPYAPGDFQQAWGLAKIVVGSGLNPNLKSPEGALMAMAIGHRLGLDWTASVTEINIIEGKATLSARGQLGLIKSKAACEYVREIESTKEKSTWETKRRGEPAPVRHTFSIEDARTAELTGKRNWVKYPREMLSARAVSGLLRKVFPDILAGIYEPEEMEPTAPSEVRVVMPAPTPVEAPVPAPSPEVFDAVFEPVAAAPGPEPTPEWAAPLVAATSAKELASAASAAMKVGVPAAEVKPIYEARRAEIAK